MCCALISSFSFFRWAVSPAKSKQLMSESGAGPHRMSGFLHRSQSEIEPFSPGGKKRVDTARKGMESGSLTEVGEENGVTNHKGPVSPSPLRIFSQAKKKMNEIFVELDAQVKESTTFLKSKWSSGCTWHDLCIIVFFLFTEVSQAVLTVDMGMVEHVEKQYSKIKGITEMVARDHMKVVFFGRQVSDFYFKDTLWCFVECIWSISVFL